MDEERAEIGAGLKRARELAGLNQPEAATALGLKKQTISSWEKGRNLPDPITLRRLARLYRTTVDGLLGQVPVSAQSTQLGQEIDSLADADRDLVITVTGNLVRELKQKRSTNDIPQTPARYRQN